MILVAFNAYVSRVSEVVFLGGEGSIREPKASCKIKTEERCTMSETGLSKGRGLRS